MPGLVTQSPLLAAVPGLRHGFTGKLTSPEENAALDATVATARQVHRAGLLWVEAYEKKAREADAVATLRPGLAVGVYSADCTPVLVAALDASTNEVYAVMAVHAGWRGTALGIAGRAFGELAQAARARAGRETRFVAAIGPCIGFERFEVGEEVVQVFPGALDRGLARFLRLEHGKKKYLVDLPGEDLRQLRQAADEAKAPLEADVLGLCTVELAERFPSYRRDREKAGRILSFLSFTS
jgi:YfiH family protein